MKLFLKYTVHCKDFLLLHKSTKTWGEREKSGKNGRKECDTNYVGKSHIKWQQMCRKFSKKLDSFICTSSSLDYFDPVKRGEMTSALKSRRRWWRCPSWTQLMSASCIPWTTLVMVPGVKFVDDFTFSCLKTHDKLNFMFRLLSD